ncbi:hypothetical protein ILUMI_02618 [Ignelater luminosus]|uniref:CRAL-TRIO domain-containing protein n=1 Tax=Ignelater luminosus TaxID=2038154 RepID=A0A8K0DC82_IGNLU|nr:hypothetical protein ILUMI_02618 [Ignelater luminosus]
MYMDVLLNEDDNSTVNGLYILHDMKGFSLGYVKHLTPALCKKVILSVQNAYPFRLKGIYCINTPAIYDVFISMFTPFFNEKLRSRFKVFKEDAAEKFHEYIPQKVLPKEYGGNAGPMSKINGNIPLKIYK